MNRIIVTLSNGKRVANFSSPHPFDFEDGCILPARSNEQAERLKVTFIEEPVGMEGDVKLSFELSHDVKEEMRCWFGEYVDGMIDVVFCPLPMLTAAYANGYDVRNSPFRSIRVTDRISKKISITNQCL